MTRSAGALQPRLLADDAGTREAWSRLAERGRNVFSTPEWVDAWARTVASDRPIVLLGCLSQDAELRAVWPLTSERRGPLTILRIAGHGAADEQGPACAPDDRAGAAGALRRALDARLVPGTVALLERLPSGTEWDRLLRGAVVTTEPSPVLPVEGRSFDEYLATRSRQFRNQVRRFERRLASRHRVDVDLVDRAEELDGALDVLLDLHATRWGEASDAFSAARLPLHRAFAASALGRGWLRLWVLRTDGEPAAAWYGFRYAGADAFYQSGRDRTRDDLAIGSVLLAHTVRATFDDGLDEYRFLRGDEAYKRRWTEDGRTVDTILAPARRRARPLVAAAAAATRSPWIRSAAGRALG